MAGASLRYVALSTNWTVPAPGFVNRVAAPVTSSHDVVATAGP